MSPLTISLIGLAGFLVLMFVGVPIAFSFAIAGVIGIILLKSLNIGLSVLGTAPYTWASQEALVVVPLFVLMGQFAFHSGISTELFSAAYKWIGRIPGGLALATILACTGFGACTGSAIASAATMSTVCYPEMKRFGYEPELASGSIAAGGTLGILIPPSSIMIIYGFFTGTPIGPLFIAGILPGLVISGLFMAVILVRSIRNPKVGPPGERFRWRERFAALVGIWGMLVLFALVIGGLYFGIFTPSEAGAIGAFGAFVIAIIRRKLTWSALVTTLRESLITTCFTLTILIGAMIFSAFLAVAGFPAMVSSWVSSLNFSPHAILAIILFLYIVLGLAMDEMSMIMLTIPIVFPIIQKLGFDPLWFGVLIVIVVEMGMISPPVGITMYTVQGMTKLPIGQIFRGVLPFFLVMFLGLAILVAFPQISLFLPSIMK